MSCAREPPFLSVCVSLTSSSLLSCSVSFNRAPLANRNVKRYFVFCNVVLDLVQRFFLFLAHRDYQRKTRENTSSVCLLYNDRVEIGTKFLKLFGRLTLFDKSTGIAPSILSRCNFYEQRDRELAFKERMQVLEKGTRESNERQEYLVFHANRCTGRKWTYDIT